jgi:hypothetical protein
MSPEYLPEVGFTTEHVVPSEFISNFNPDAESVNVVSALAVSDAPPTRTATKSSFSVLIVFVKSIIFSVYVFLMCVFPMCKKEPKPSNRKGAFLVVFHKSVQM